VQFLGEATVKGTLYELPGYPFPGMLLNTSERTVKGEVYGLSREGLCWLDAFEGYRGTDSKANHYIRRDVTARFQNGSEAKCALYEINAERFELGDIIEAGDWIHHTLPSQTSHLHATDREL
jgi:gamma-glutamylcyclotransferase (GGCT)/AIG2-like uncharacterized protein YtfP